MEQTVKIGGDSAVEVVNLLVGRIAGQKPPWSSLTCLTA